MDALQIGDADGEAGEGDGAPQRSVLRKTRWSVTNLFLHRLLAVGGVICTRKNELVQNIFAKIDYKHLVVTLQGKSRTTPGSHGSPRPAATQVLQK